jgi:3'-phosphoadenosine 5'-phosphosulfate sulfotransferase (PAPS reductase)/FAD synthetase
MTDPFKIIEPTVISFSGGRTSAYMLWRIIQAHDGVLPEDAIVCFANTGKEDEATLQFVRDCETNWGIEIHWLEYTSAKPKYKKVSFSNPGHAHNLAKKLNKLFKTADFAVYKLTTGEEIK